MNKYKKRFSKGFTLIELLAVIIILSVVLAITAPTVNNLINSSYIKTYELDLKVLEDAAKNYVLKGYLTIDDSQLRIVTLDNLIETELASEIIDPRTKLPCDGYVAVNKTSGIYTYKGSLKCGSNYASGNYGAEDPIPPAITILGDNPISIRVGQSYVDAGATALDNLDGDLTESIVVTNNVNTQVLGEYEVIYTVSDRIGNTSTATRIVNVEFDEFGCYAFDTATKTITGYDALNCPSSNLVLPQAINGNNVEYIGEWAFADKGLTGSLNLSNMTYLRGINEGAFANNPFGGNLTLGSLSNLQYIGIGAFAEMYADINDRGFIGALNLSGLTNLQEINNDAFANNNFTSLNFGTLPNLTRIGSMVFSGSYGCSSDHKQFTGTLEMSGLTTLNDIGMYVFSFTGFTSAILPPSLQTIPTDSFNYTFLQSVTIPNSVTTIGYGAFRYSQLTSVTIPNSVTTIEGSAFENNQLTSVSIPSGVTTISGYTFANNQLTSVTIPSGVTTIESGAFSQNLLTSVTIPSSVTYLSGFSNNQITSATIPSSVTTIGSEAFAGNQLTSVTIPSSVTSIESYAFYGNRLTAITIPSGVTTIGYAALANYEDSNPNLTTVSNKTGRSFNWGSIIRGTGTFVTGTLPRWDGGTITITN